MSYKTGGSKARPGIDKSHEVTGEGYHSSTDKDSQRYDSDQAPPPAAAASAGKTSKKKGKDKQSKKDKKRQKETGLTEGPVDGGTVSILKPTPGARTDHAASPALSGRSGRADTRDYDSPALSMRPSPDPSRRVPTGLTPPPVRRADTPPSDHQYPNISYQYPNSSTLRSNDQARRARPYQYPNQRTADNKRADYIGLKLTPYGYPTNHNWTGSSRGGESDS